MENFLLIINQPVVLWSLLSGAVIAVLIDYLFPVDWLAFVGYALFAVFMGATVPVGPLLSILVMFITFAAMLLLHRFIFAKFLTNAPYCYRCQEPEPDGEEPN